MRRHGTSMTIRTCTYPKKYTSAWSHNNQPTPYCLQQGCGRDVPTCGSNLSISLKAGEDDLLLEAEKFSLMSSFCNIKLWGGQNSQISQR
jgi:hypothetical protein